MKGIIVLSVSLAALAAAIVLGGCSKSFCVGSGCSISGDTVASKVQTALDSYWKAHGLSQPPPVTCPDSLDSKAGAMTHCTAKVPVHGQTATLGIDVKVTSTQGSKYNLDIHPTGLEN